MVGYFDAEMSPGKEDTPPRDPLATTADCTLGPLMVSLNQRVSPGDRTEAPVKKVVCSPDLPIFPFAGENQPTEEAATVATDKVYQCSFCRKTFGQKNTYQNHLRSHSKEGEDPYQCNICGKTFAVPARLTRHYRTHTGEKPYQCEYCNKSFSVKENLSVHRRIHTKERPYKCDICERAFEHSGKLHRHMRIHTGERPHKCSICSKTFIQSGQLVIHMRTHTGEKPYVCKVCQKGFTCSKQLKVHTRTHTGEKPYTCEICGKSFGYNHVLKLHQVAHYGEKVYKCTICNETFTSKKMMEVHIKSHSDPTALSRIAPHIDNDTSSASSSDKENKGGPDSEPESPRAPSQGPSECESEPPSALPTTFTAFPPVQELRRTSSPMPPQQQQIQQQQQQQQQQQPHPNMRDLYYYLYPHVDLERGFQTAFSYLPQSPRLGVNPMLLAAAASNMAGRTSPPPERFFNPSRREERSPSPEDMDEPMEIEINNQGMQQTCLPVTEPPIYLCPEPLASMQRRRLSPESSYLQLPPEYLDPPALIALPLTNKRQAESPLTPPSSNPVSPAPSSSPDLDTGRETLILPPRKRSKMILKHMEESASAMRYSSVIHYAEKGHH